MQTPSGLVEELALERAAIVEHEERATALWNARLYAGAQNERRAAREARKRVRELEREIVEQSFVTGIDERTLIIEPEGDA